MRLSWKNSLALKRKKKPTLGRADLYFNLKKVDYLVESKWRWTSVNKRSGIDRTGKWAKEALKQVQDYTEDARVPKENVFSLCLETIAFTKNDFNHNYKESINLWQIKRSDALGCLDFYSLIEVTLKVEPEWHCYDDLYFPALAVYGVFNKRKSKEVKVCC
jgi:hypothetical protein